MNLVEISEAEHSLVAEAGALYGEYFDHAQYAANFFNSFLKSASPEATFFAMFMAVVEKHIDIGMLSSIRLHHVQATLDFRYATEAGCWAAFALAHPDPTYFGMPQSNGTFEPTQTLKIAMYKWIEDKYPTGNASVKQFKDQLNALSTHANIVDAYRNFKELSRDNISTSFFDNSEEHHVKTDLWTAGNLTMGLLDLFYGVAQDFPVILFADDFLSRMAILKGQNDKLKAEMMNHPRLKIHAPN